MDALSIKCPFCQKSFQLSEVIYKQIQYEIEKGLEDNFNKRDQDLKQKEDAILKDRQQLNKDKKYIDKKISDQLKIDRAKLKEEFDVEKAKRDQDLKQKEDAILKDRQQLNKDKKDVDEKIADQLKIERAKLEKDLNKQLRDKTKDIEKTNRLTILDMRKEIEDYKKQIDDLKRKSDQRGPEKGEVAEQMIEKDLKDIDASDTIERVPRGKRGADIVHTVFDSGINCGVILWEVKRAKIWSKTWIKKIKEDMLNINGNIGVIISKELPNDVKKSFGLINGIWISNYEAYIGLAYALRGQLIEITYLKNSMKDSSTKRDKLYNYLSGTEFRERINAIVEVFVSMNESLNREKSTTMRNWAEREVQINSVIENVSKMYGKMKGIIGASLPEISNLEPVALPKKSK